MAEKYKTVKDYDTTLARIAGNIAAGLVNKPGLLDSEDESIAEMSVNLAEKIVEQIRARHISARPDVDLLLFKAIDAIGADCRCGNLDPEQVKTAIREALACK